MGKVVLFADAGEVLEVCSVGAQGGGGFGSANVESQNYKADRTVCFSNLKSDSQRNSSPTAPAVGSAIPKNCYQRLTISGLAIL